MKLEVKAYSALCALERFEINGISADHEDFGDKFDHAPESAEEYCCGDMRFVPKPATPQVLEKYGITEEEYGMVCNELDCLSFGSCVLCS